MASEAPVMMECGMREFELCGGFMEGNKLVSVLLTTVDILDLPYTYI